MSVVVYDGANLTKDPDAQRVFTFDWTADIGSASISTSTWTITGPDAALTYDNGAIASGSKMTTVRVLGGTLGKTYTLSNRIVTNASPTETEDASITFTIRAQ